MTEKAFASQSDLTAKQISFVELPPGAVFDREMWSALAQG